MNLTGKGGFTLIELAIVLTILGLLLGGGSMLLKPMMDNNKRNETKARLKVIEDALAVYAANNQDLPCPSNPALGAGAAANGLEATPGSAACTGTTVSSGGVPWRSLGLSESDVLDGWGRRISYAITAQLAVTGATPKPLDCKTNGFSSPLFLQGKLESRGANNEPITPGSAGVNANPARAAYILVSHGENGAGGYLRTGLRMPTTTASTTELGNVKAIGVGAAATAVFYYEKRVTGDAITGFDDIVRSRTSGQIAIAYGCSKP